MGTRQIHEDYLIVISNSADERTRLDFKLCVADGLQSDSEAIAVLGLMASSVGHSRDGQTHIYSRCNNTQYTDKTKGLATAAQKRHCISSPYGPRHEF